MSGHDNLLIAEYAARRADDAFAALVRQHLNLVFATAVRQVGDTGAAEEITQNVFVALARASGKLKSHPTIAGWLYQTTLNKSREWLRSELRRRHREQVAVHRQLADAEGDSVWSPLVPLLDEALLKLREPDRLAVIMHFMEGQTFEEVGTALGVGEDTARKRVNRCLHELTHFFQHRGFAIPALTAATPLFALASQPAPAGLAASATTAALATAHSAASTSTLTLVKGALKIMAWTNAKTAIVVGVAVLLSGGTLTIVEVAHPSPSEQGKTILSKVIAANRFWLLAPSDAVTDYSYVLHLQWPSKFAVPPPWIKAPDGSIETSVNVPEPRNAPIDEREGTTYSSVLQWLAQHPELARVQSIKTENGKITLALKFVPAPGVAFVFRGEKHPFLPLQIECGYGLRTARSNVHSYNFTTSATNAVLVIDAQRMIPLSSIVPTGDNQAVEETFSNYTEVTPGHYVPLAVDVKCTGFEFNLTFKLQDSLWLFNEGKWHDKKVAWTDQVVVH